MDDGKLHISVQQVTEMSLKLGRKVKDYCRENQIKVDRVCYIPRGGLQVANLAGRLLGAEADRYHALCLKSYDNKTRQQLDSGIKFYQTPNVGEIKGKVCVLFDEVCDTGATFEAAYNWLIDSGAKQVITAVLHAKPVRTFEPSIYIEETDAWIVYPWEAAEKEGADDPVMS